jgi:hypothetical protein
MRVRGGQREGSGRKPLAAGEQSVTMQFRVPAEVKAEIMDRGGSEWIRQLVMLALRKSLADRK